ncbi:integrase core domain-containing protein [Rosistilla ulvae]|uniref:integrase core domain-containing protein n=1 Tax=Rosistilla ulvae TaxID=1930277 RepID=UPI0011A5793D
MPRHAHASLKGLGASRRTALDPSQRSWWPVPRQILKRSSIRQSMSRAGDGYDNAFMESCFGTIKTELEMIAYETVTEGERELGSYFRCYNQDRKHSSLGYQKPTQFESPHPGQE